MADYKPGTCDSCHGDLAYPTEDGRTAGYVKEPSRIVQHPDGGTAVVHKSCLPAWQEWYDYCMTGGV